MGLRSFSIIFGGEHFGMSLTTDSFSCDATTPCPKEVLYRSDKTGANSQANSFQILLGATSGPRDLFNLIGLV